MAIVATKCGRTYSPAELIDPVSTLSGAKPEIRSAPHLFIQLEPLHEFLDEWTQTSEHAATRGGQLSEGALSERALARLGCFAARRHISASKFPIAPATIWYVWFDAPIGYMASLDQWCQKTGEKFDEWWPRGANAQSLGPKSITSSAKTSRISTRSSGRACSRPPASSCPAKVHIHGFLTVGGEKMSKSKGTFIQASTYLEAPRIQPTCATTTPAKLSSRVDDLDLNPDEFVTKVNSDLVGKVVNLASRTARFVEESGLSTKYPDDDGLFSTAAKAGDSIAEAYEACDYSRAMREIMASADRANQYVDAKAPWTLRKDPSRAKEMQDVCTVSLNLFRQLTIYLAPVLPQLAKQAGELLNDPIASWEQSKQPLVGTKVNKFQPMLTRVEPAQVQAMIEETKESAPVATNSSAGSGAGSPADGPEPLQAEALAPECTIDDFTKVDLRVARILTAEEVPDGAQAAQAHHQPRRRCTKNRLRRH